MLGVLWSAWRSLAVLLRGEVKRRECGGGGVLRNALRGMFLGKRFLGFGARCNALVRIVLRVDRWRGVAGEGSRGNA